MIKTIEDQKIKKKKKKKKQKKKLKLLNPVEHRQKPKSIAGFFPKELEKMN